MASARSLRSPATLIPGAWIGPEVTVAVAAVLEPPFTWDVRQGGPAGITARGTASAHDFSRPLARRVATNA